MAFNFFGNSGGQYYDYGNGFANSYIQPSINPSVIGAGGGVVGNSFSSVLSGISQNASMGVSPFQQNSGANLTPGQIAAQMQIGGPASVLPIMGGKFLPKLLFPIAGLWSLVQGLRTFAQTKTEAAMGINKFDASQMAYNQQRADVDNYLTQTVFNSGLDYTPEF